MTVPDTRGHDTPEQNDLGPDEVLTMGRMGVDIYPLQVGTSLRHVETFGKFLGGSPANVAVAAARLGRRSAVITRTGADPFGEFLHDALQGFGVDDRFVTAVPDLPTPVTFCEIFPPDDFPLYFYRLPTAPDLQIRADELDLDAVRDAEIFWVTVTGLSQEPSREATLAALRARDRRGTTILDLDYRPMFWTSREEARRWVAQALPYVTVTAGNLDEVETAVGVREPRQAAKALHEAGVELAIVKQGPAGVLASDGNSEVEVPPVPVEVVNGLGAGDAFGGALCHSLLAGWDLQRSMRFCNAAGAIAASRLACADAMPTADEIETKIAEADAETSNREADRG
jgi:5-dehydro-2-deoxygluconokinase